MPSCLGIYFSDNVIRYAKLVTDSANNVRLDHYGTRIAKGIRKDIVESIIDETSSAEIPIVTNVLNENLVEVSIFDQAQESQYSPDIMKLEFETWCEKNQKTPDKYKYVYKLSDYRTAENKHNGILCISSKDDIEQSTKINDTVAQAVYPSKLLYTDLAPQDVSNYIIVNLDEKLSIETVINRRMFDYKLYTIGIADVLSAVEMKLGNYQRAYAACKQLNVYTEGEDTNDKEVASIVEPILQEILRNIASVVEANKDTISRVYITGMGIIFNNMDVLLTEYLGIKTSILKPKFLSDTSDVRSIAEVLETTQAMVMAYNFLMNKNRFLDYVKRVPEKKKNDFIENIKAKFSSVKFKKKENKQKEPAENATRNDVSTADQVKEQKKINIKIPEIEKNVALNVMVSLATIATLIFIAYLAFTVIYTTTNNKMIADVTNKINALNGEIAKANSDILYIQSNTKEYTDINDDVDTLVSQIQTGQIGKVSTYNVASFLQKLIKVIPKNVTLDTLKSDDNKNVIITMYSNKYADLGYFVAQLKLEGILNSVKVNKIENSADKITIEIGGELP